MGDFLIGEKHLEEAINLLRRAVKDSHLENQKHLDLTLVSAHERGQFQRALIVTKESIRQGIISQDELDRRLGLIS